MEVAAVLPPSFFSDIIIPLVPSSLTLPTSLKKLRAGAPQSNYSAVADVVHHPLHLNVNVISSLQSYRLYPPYAVLEHKSSHHIMDGLDSPPSPIVSINLYFSITIRCPFNVADASRHNRWTLSNSIISCDDKQSNGSRHNVV